MNGSPTTSKSDWKRVQEEYRSGRPPADDPDAPNVAHLMRAELDRLRRGRVPGSGTKEQLTLRLDSAVLAAFKATGKGWQTRLNDALREWLKEHPMNPA
jgi:uncharacterized protein (DUF4415 family)